MAYRHIMDIYIDSQYHTLLNVCPVVLLLQILWNEHVKGL